jgi:hypothetical protein
MKRHNIIVTICFLAGSFLASNINANDGLNSLFNNTKSNTNNSSSIAFTPADLKAFVDSIPTQNAEALNDTTYKFDVEYRDYSFPTLVQTNETGSIIWATFNLAPIPENSSPDEYAAILLKLLASNGEFGDFFFSYSEESRMITIHGCIQVRSTVTSQELTDHLIRMGDIAVEKQNLWNPSLWNQDNPRHIGTWHSESHKMDLKLAPSNRFDLTAGGNPMSGNYTIDGDQLTMTDGNGETSFQSWSTEMKLSSKECNHPTGFVTSRCN